MKLSLTIILLIFSVYTVNGWWNEGHMITAQIAKDSLLSRYNEIANNKTNWTYGQVYDQASWIVDSLNYLSTPLTHDFVQDAPWPDDLKETGYTFMDAWHFINQEYNPSNYTDNTFKPDPTNLIFALNQIYKIVYYWKQGKGYPFPPYNITNQDFNENPISMQVSEMTRYLIHLVGDLHQPLHCTAYVSNEFPSGDAGGNLIEIIFNNTPTELHAFWDSGAYMLPSLTRPLNQTGRDMIENWASNFSTTYPRSYFEKELSVHNWTEWAHESYEKAIKYIYDDILPYDPKNPPVITPEYQQRSYTIVQQQLALGGYRLADLIVDYFSTYSQVDYDQPPYPYIEPPMKPWATSSVNNFIANKIQTLKKL